MGRVLRFIPFASYVSRTSELARNEIKDEGALRRAGVRVESYHELHGINHPSNSLSDFLPTDSIKVEGRISNSPPENAVPHYDPNFRTRPASYGDYWKGERSLRSGHLHGRLPKKWKDADPEKNELFIFFHATLTPFTTRSSFTIQSRRQRQDYGVYLIGKMKVARFIRIGEGGWTAAIDENSDVRETIIQNFHFKYQHDNPVIAIGESHETFLTRKAVLLKRVSSALTRPEITELGKAVGVKPKDTVRFKFLYTRELATRVSEAMDDAR